MQTFIFTILLLALAAVAVHVLVPNEFSVSRSIEISAPIETVFAQVDNLHNYSDWNPWSKLDTTSVSVFEGPASGVGAKMSWVGKKIGAGSMLNVDSKPYSHVQFQLDFLKPMRAKHIAEFRFTQMQGRTHIVWGMYGKNNFVGKIFNLVMNCDKMIGDQFEAGLTNLKLRLEKM